MNQTDIIKLPKPPELSLLAPPIPPLIFLLDYRLFTNEEAHSPSLKAIPNNIRQYIIFNSFIKSFTSDPEKFCFKNLKSSKQAERPVILTNKTELTQIEIIKKNDSLASFINSPSIYNDFIDESFTSSLQFIVKIILIPSVLILLLIVFIIILIAFKK